MHTIATNIVAIFVQQILQNHASILKHFLLTWNDAVCNIWMRIYSTYYSIVSLIRKKSAILKLTFMPWSFRVLDFEALRSILTKPKIPWNLISYNEKTWPVQWWGSNFFQIGLYMFRHEKKITKMQKSLPAMIKDLFIYFGFLWRKCIFLPEKNHWSKWISLYHSNQLIPVKTMMKSLSGVFYCFILSDGSGTRICIFGYTESAEKWA